MNYVKQFSWLLVLILLLSAPALACATLGLGGEEEPTTSRDEEEAEEEEEEEEAEEEESDAAADEEEAPVEEADEETDEEDAADEAAADADADSDAPAEESDEAPAALGSTVNINELTMQEDLVFDDYRFVFDFSVTVTDSSGEETSQVLYAEALYNTNPQAFSMEFTVEGLAGMEGFNSFSMAQIGNTTYTIFPELGCISASGEEMVEDPLAEIASQEQFLENIGAAEFVGEEMINGVETLHYIFDESSLEGEEMGDIRSLTGDAYIAKDLGYVVRFIMEGEGILFDFAEEDAVDGSFRTQFDLLDVNSGLVVEVPEGCEPAGDTGDAGGTGTGDAGGDATVDSDDFPMLADASNVTSFADFLTYSTATPFDEIVTFYNDELSAAGWSYSEEESFILEGSTAFLFFTNEAGSSLNVTVAEDTETEGGFLVLITAE